MKGARSSVIIDIFSLLVGWMVSPAEAGELGEALIADGIQRHGIERDQLTLQGSLASVKLI